MMTDIQKQMIKFFPELKWRDLNFMGQGFFTNISGIGVLVAISDHGMMSIAINAETSIKDYELIHNSDLILEIKSKLKTVLNFQ